MIRIADPRMFVPLTLLSRRPGVAVLRPRLDRNNLVSERSREQTNPTVAVMSASDPQRTFSQSTLEYSDTINSAGPLAEEEGPSITIGVTCVGCGPMISTSGFAEGRSRGFATSGVSPNHGGDAMLRVTSPPSS